MDSESDMCMDKNGKDTKQNGHIVRKMHLVRNGEECNMKNIDWCEGGLQLADIANKDVGDNDLTPMIKYIMLRLENWYRTLVQEGWHNTG